MCTVILQVDILNLNHQTPPSVMQLFQQLQECGQRSDCGVQHRSTLKCL